MISGGKSFAAPGSAGVDDGTTGFGAHPGTKTVASFAFYIARLKRSLAHFYILSGCPCCWKEMATPLFDARVLISVRYMVTDWSITTRGKAKLAK